VAAAAAYVERQDPDGVVLMLAADHHIAQAEIFGQAAVTAAQAARSDLIVTFGVQPTTPATGFGYIRPGDVLLDGSVSGPFSYAAVLATRSARGAENIESSLQLRWCAFSRAKPARLARSHKNRAFTLVPWHKSAS
jgi:hypothetical protein